MRSAILSSIGLFSLILAVAAQADEAGNAAPFPWEGEVTGMNVYVRSGPGTNWYPTAKLNAGDRVLVLGEKFGWYSILPPPDSFSYIDRARVDRPAGAATGTVRQDKVYVRAGSPLERRKSATQVVLSKGAKVRIIGEADGFYKIVPPRGATLYMSKRYVSAVPPRLRTGLLERHRADLPPVAVRPGVRSAVGETDWTGTQAMPTHAATPEIKPAATPDAGAPPGRSKSSEANVDDDGPPLQVDPTLEALQGGEPIPAEAPSAAPSADAEEGEVEVVPAIDRIKKKPSTGRFQTMLTVIESELKAEMTKPLVDQNLGGLLTRYEEIAAQADEYVPAAIAKLRARQLKERIELRTVRSRLREERDDIESFRGSLKEKRMEAARRRAVAVLDDYDLEGVLLRSHAFAPEKRRYRLIDPQRRNTIAYVDIPPTVDAKIEHLIGRTVGIRIAGQDYSPSARVPVAVAADITEIASRMQKQLQMPPRTELNRDRPGAANISPAIAKSTREPAGPDGKAEARPPVTLAGQPAEVED